MTAATLFAFSVPLQTRKWSRSIHCGAAVSSSHASQSEHVTAYENCRVRYDEGMEKRPAERLTRQDFILSIWQDIVSCLEERDKQLWEEIKHYPTPIAGCDQQFNYLLEQQNAILRDLGQARSAYSDVANHEDAVETITRFITSSCLEKDAQELLLSRLSGAPHLSH